MLRTTISLAVLVASATVAHAGQHKYVGVHPISAKADDGLCYIEVPHVHVYAPKRAKVQYRVVDGYYHFVGDPVAYEYDGPKHSYYGHHPIEITVDAPHTEYCYIDGPHYHGFEPPSDATFKVHAGAYWYIGPFDAYYTTHRKQYVRINKVVAHVDYERPVVEFDAPPIGYMGPVVDVHVGVPAAVVDVHGPVVDVHAPAVEVHVPAPSLEVSFGFGAHVHGGHEVHSHRKHKHYKHKRKHYRSERKYYKKRHKRRHKSKLIKRF